MDEYIGHDDLRHKLQQILDNVRHHPQIPAPGGRGAEHVGPGRQEVKGEDDPLLAARGSWWPTTSRTSARRSATCCASTTST